MKKYRISSPTLTCIAFMASPIAAIAGMIERDGWAETASPNKPVMIYGTSNTTPDCKSDGYPRLQIIQAPTHGRIEIRKGKRHPNIPKSNIRYKCNKVLVDGLLVFYTAPKAFSGQDKVVIRKTPVSLGSISETTITITSTRK